MNSHRTFKFSTSIVALLILSLTCCAKNDSEQPIQSQKILIELQYSGGQIAPEYIPKLQVIEGSIARLQTGANTREAEIPIDLNKHLLAKATNPNFLALDSASLKVNTEELMKKMGSTSPNIMDASVPTIRVWKGQSYHTVSFYAPRAYMRHTGDNPGLARFVELLNDLEQLYSFFPDN